MTMKTKLLLVLGAARAQIDTTGGRYYRSVFANVTVMPGVVYGAAVIYQGTTQTLLIYIHQPIDDVLARRPVIIFAH